MNYLRIKNRKMRSLTMSLIEQTMRSRIFSSKMNRWNMNYKWRSYNYLRPREIWISPIQRRFFDWNNWIMFLFELYKNRSLEITKWPRNWKITIIQAPGWYPKIRRLAQRDYAPVKRWEEQLLWEEQCSQQRNRAVAWISWI